MAGGCEESGGVEEVSPSGGEGRKRGLSGSMSLRTRKLGRRLSRSMSIVALKLPEKAQSITRSSTKLIRSGARDKKNRSFELSIILPDKTQKQVKLVVDYIGSVTLYLFMFWVEVTFQHLHTARLLVQRELL